MLFRHPFSRLISAWRDKFRNKHPWFIYVEKNYGPVLRRLERRDMTGEDYEISFEAFVEYVALTESDCMRDKHWKSLLFCCSFCAIPYEFVIKQEGGQLEQDFVKRALNVRRYGGELQFPWEYATSLSYPEELELFKHVPQKVGLAWNISYINYNTIIIIL